MIRNSVAGNSGGTQVGKLRVLLLEGQFWDHFSAESAVFGEMLQMVDGGRIRNLSA